MTPAHGSIVYLDDGIRNWNGEKLFKEVIFNMTNRKLCIYLFMITKIYVVCLFSFLRTKDNDLEFSFGQLLER